MWVQLKMYFFLIKKTRSKEQKKLYYESNENSIIVFKYRVKVDPQNNYDFLFQRIWKAKLVL